ncbi:TRAP transporter small permease subunit [Litoreibacter albidus]|uniref:TRAP transporter small permease protein n=1 Tax=Litoreibacter albidus TaxID=670155 RepID=A0A1H3DL38_9RHOB|nr:TRAP transporter small permease subunit [Litoreibacter albidus]SDX67111.1 TRAP-type mannitol/chloroaromatic compound transport system, small permease component [Litoreibacter albidus]
MFRAALAITTLNRWTFEAAKWLVYVIAGLMLFEVISRYSLQNPTSWGPELATLLFGPFFLLGGPYLLHLGGHVAVDVLSSNARGRLRVVLAVMAALLALLFGLILLRFSLPLAWQAFEYGETSYSAWNPIIWPAKMVLPLAALLLVFQSLAEVVFAVKGRSA